MPPIAAQVYERIHRLRREAYDSSDYLEAFAEKRNPIFEGSDFVRQPFLPELGLLGPLPTLLETLEQQVLRR